MLGFGVFLDTVTDAGGIYVFGWSSVSVALSLGESVCCIAALRPLGLLACICVARIPLQVKYRQWISGRFVSKAGRVQTAPLICPPLRRIGLLLVAPGYLTMEKYFYN